MQMTRLNRWIVLVGFAWLVAVTGPVFAGNVPAGNDGQPEHRAKAEVEYTSRVFLGQGVTLARLSNGLTVIVRENHAAPVATVRSYVCNTGSAFEGKYLGAGLSHVLEHLVAGGTTKKRSEKEIQQLVDTLGGQTNAYTSNDITAFYIDCPAKGVDLAIELVADSMHSALIPEEEYRRELGVVQRELEMGETQRSRVRYQLMKQQIFTEHPMRHPVIGYLSVLQQTTRDDLLDYYHDRYVPQNLVFVVVGDVDTDSVLEQTLKNFKNFQRTTERGPVMPIEPDQASPRSIIREMPGETVNMSVAWPTVPLQHPDLYPLDVASYLLTHGDSSRLEKRLRIDEPLAISVSSSSYTPGFVKGWFQVTVECQPENAERCKQIIFEEIERLKTTPVSEKELAKVKRQKAAEHVFSQTTVQAQAESLASSYRSTGDPLFDDQYVAGIQQVTAEEITEVARKYFHPERLNTVIIEPIGSRANREKQKTESSVESPVVRKQLANGLTVLLKRHAVLPMVNMQAFAKGGVISDGPQTAGRAALTAEMMNKGTKKYTAEQIAEYFDSIGGSLAMDSQRNTSFLQMAVLKADFAAAFDYAYEVLVNPTFPQDEFEKVRAVQLGRIASRSANPQAQIVDAWVRGLPKDSPYCRTVLGNKETVSALTVDACRELHRQVFVPENMVLAIFGDIDIDETLKLVEQTFGQLPAGKVADLNIPQQHTGWQADRRKLAGQQPNSAMVVLGYPTVAATDQKTRPALDVLDAILTGGQGGRLFQELRGARLVYYVFGFELTGLSPGYFLFMAQTRPETADEVVERIQAGVDRIKKEGVPEEEFEKTKQKLIAAHAMKNTTASSQAFQAAIDELYGLGYDNDAGYDQRIQSVTIDDVRKVVEEYFHDPLILISAPETPPADKAAE